MIKSKILLNYRNYALLSLILLTGCQLGQKTASGGTLAINAVNTFSISATGSIPITASLTGTATSSSSTTVVINFSVDNTNVANFKNSNSCTITIPANGNSGSCSQQLTGFNAGVVNITANGNNQNSTFSITVTK